jgi:hypothetical protein
MLLSESNAFQGHNAEEASFTYIHTLQIWFTGIQHFLKISAHSILDECIIGR